MESFPFANDNAGTIRMRSNGHGLVMQDDDDMHLQQQQQQLHLQQQQQQQLHLQQQQHHLQQQQQHLQNGANMEDCSKTSSQNLPPR